MPRMLEKGSEVQVQLKADVVLDDEGKEKLAKDAVLWLFVCYCRKRFIAFETAEGRAFSLARSDFRLL